VVEYQLRGPETAERARRQFGDELPGHVDATPGGVGGGGRVTKRRNSRQIAAPDLPDCLLAKLAGKKQRRNRK